VRNLTSRKKSLRRKRLGETLYIPAMKKNGKKKPRWIPIPFHHARATGTKGKTNKGGEKGEEGGVGETSGGPFPLQVQ